jgi:hypothetical protein
MPVLILTSRSRYAVNSEVKNRGFKHALGRAWWDEIYPTCICRMQVWCVPIGHHADGAS